MRSVIKLNKLLLAVFLFGGVFLITPNKVFAQLTEDQIKCAEEVGFGGQSFNIEEYVAPNCGGGDCPPISASTVGNDYSYVNAVSNQIEWLDRANSVYKQKSNEIHFLYKVEDGLIKLMQDTTWGGNAYSDDKFFHCGGADGPQAMYRAYDESGSWGRWVLKTSMSCGDSVNKGGYFQSYPKDPDLETNWNKDLDPTCNVAGQTDQAGTPEGQSVTMDSGQQLIFQGNAICNDINDGKPAPVIVTLNVGGAGSEEGYVYCEGAGLCAHYQTLDFEKSGYPTDWDESTDVCDLKSRGDSTKGVREPYYVEPIAGTFDFANPDFRETSPNQTFDKIYEDLVAQGYQSYCAMPDLKYMVSDNVNPFIGDQILQKEIAGGNRISVTMEDYKQFFDYLDAKTPIWRKKGVYVLKDKDSMEAFWTHKDELQKIGTVAIDYSPAYALTTPTGQCQEKTKILNAVNKKCNNMTDPNTCALDISFRSGSYRFKELYDEMQAVDFDCNMMNQSYRQLYRLEKEIMGDEAHFEKIKSSIMHMPFSMPTAYRFAFAVYSAEMREPKTIADFDSGREWSEATHAPGFDFLRYDPERITRLGLNSSDHSGKPRSNIRILAFLVPDFGTNLDNFEFQYTSPPEIMFKDGQGLEDMQVAAKEIVEKNHTPAYGGELDYKDALKVVRNSFLTPNEIEIYKEKWKEKKERVTFNMTGIGTNGKIFDFEPTNPIKQLVSCLFYVNQPAPAEYRCEQPLAMALAIFINRRTENPKECHQENIKYQKNDTIFDDAGIKLNDIGLEQTYEGYSGNILRDGFYPQNVANIIPNSNDASGEGELLGGERIDEFRFLSHYVFTEFKNHDVLPGSLHSDDPPKSGKFSGTDTNMYIHGYLVYPQGYELDSIEKTLLGIFLTPDQIDEFNEKEYAKFFKMDGIKEKFDSAVVGKTGDDYLNKSELECRDGWVSHIASKGDSLDANYTYTDYRRDNCVQAAEARIDLKSSAERGPRLLGARLGMITIKIQQALRAPIHSSWKYVTSCFGSEKPFEDFLLGRCGGELGDNSGSDSGYLYEEVTTCEDQSQRAKIYGNITKYAMRITDEDCTVADSMGDQSEIKKVRRYVKPGEEEPGEKNHYIPDWDKPVDRVDCKSIFEPLACIYGPGIGRDGDAPILIDHFVDSDGNFDRNSKVTACDFVQNVAIEHNMNPRLALTFWIEESGASAFSNAYDFGVAVPQARPNFRDFVDNSFPEYEKYYAGYNIYNQLSMIGDEVYGYIDFVANNPDNYLGLLLQYSGEVGRADSTPEFCNNPDFPARIKSVYMQLGNYLLNNSTPQQNP